MLLEIKKHCLQNSSSRSDNTNSNLKKKLTFDPLSLVRHKQELNEYPSDNAYANTNDKHTPNRNSIKIEHWKLNKSFKI